MLWGLTPAIDFFDELPASKKCENETVNVLIIGGADFRHILKTLAKRYTHPNINYNFFLMEACMETIARQLLLLGVSLQDVKETGAYQKVRTWMELYGNSLIKPTVAKYLTVISDEFVKMVTDYVYMEKKLPFIKMDLKYKERDYLESLFKYWGSKDEFDICTYWDRLVRKDLGTRYDTKDGAFDWDLHMRFHSVGGKQICDQEYKHWRGTGVAFTWLDSEVSKPNKSLACGIVPNGSKLLTFGYMGDIRTGPYVAYGLDCDDTTMTKNSHGVNFHRSTDITEWNLNQLFYELHNNCQYEHRRFNEHQLGASRLLLPENRIVDLACPDVQSIPKEFSFKALEDVSVNFISIAHFQMLKHKEKMMKKFQIVYFATNYLRYFCSETVDNVSDDGCVLIIENPIFILGNRKEQMDKCEEELNEKLGHLKSSLSRVPFNNQKDCFAKFLIHKS